MSGKVARGSALLEPLVLLPLGTSAVTLGFGYILTMGRPPLDLRASPALVPIAHTLVAFPFVVRTLLPVMRGINPDWREAAAILGASPSAVWREVDLPIIGRALLVAALFAFTVSMGEFGATLLIARPEFPTMPLVIYRLLGQPGALELRPGHRHEHAVDAGLRGRFRAHRAVPRRPGRGVLDDRVLLCAAGVEVLPGIAGSEGGQL